MHLKVTGHIISALVIAFFSLFPGKIFSQTDTSYFVNGDDDFNLILASDAGDTTSVKLLLRRGAKVNASTIDGVTPIMYATQNGNIGLVRILADSGAIIDQKPYNGATPLIVSAKQNLYDIAEFLVNRGAKTDIRDVIGVTAVHYAAAYNNFDIMDMLIFYEADMELADDEGNTPLISAAYNNSFEAVDLLIQNGAKINSSDEDGYTPLMTSVEQGNNDIAYLLLDNGAEVNAVNKGGMSALVFAVLNQDTAMVEELIAHGADVNQQTRLGLNILELARLKKNQKIVDLLEAKGAVKMEKLTFNTLSTGAKFVFNKTDYMNGIALGLRDKKYNLGINGGFVMRVVPNRILTEISGTTYQFRERRYIGYLGIEKRFRFAETPSGLQSGLYTGINEAFTFGGYRGSKSHPKLRFITVPAAGFYINRNRLDFTAGYEFLNLKTEGINNHRITLGFNFNLSSLKPRFVYKEINWIE